MNTPVPISHLVPPTNETPTKARPPPPGFDKEAIPGLPAGIAGIAVMPTANFTSNWKVGGFHVADRLPSRFSATLIIAVLSQRLRIGLTSKTPAIKSQINQLHDTASSRRLREEIMLGNERDAGNGD